jgi:hypothetical protein
MGEDILEAEETLELAGLVNAEYVKIKQTYDEKKALYDTEMQALEDGIKAEQDDTMGDAAK